jgi:hypothetical protein
MNSLEIANFLNQHLQEKCPNQLNSCIGCHFEAFVDDEITATIFLSDPFFGPRAKLHEELQLVEKYIESRFIESIETIKAQLLNVLKSWNESEISLDHGGVYLFLWSGEMTRESFKQDTLLLISRIIKNIEEGTS